MRVSEASPLQPNDRGPAYSIVNLFDSAFAALGITTTAMTKQQAADQNGKELARIVGDRTTDAQSVFLVLPLVNEQEALTLFRSVPSGSSAETVRRLASEFRAKHPPQNSDDAKV